MREKLMALIDAADKICDSYFRCDECPYRAEYGRNCINELITEHLIANGVTVTSHCKGCERVKVDNKLTNADHIRAMSDEELAHIMVGLSDLDERIGFCVELPECKDLLDTEQGIPASKCENCMLNWLRQSAEVK